MMKHLKVLAISLTSMMTITLSSGAFAGEVYKGTWSGEAGDSTLEILSNSPVSIRYCRKRVCKVHRAKGSVKNMRVVFPKNGNFSGATLRFKKSGETYHGTYKQKGSNETYTISMTK